MRHWCDAALAYCKGSEAASTLGRALMDTVVQELLAATRLVEHRSGNDKPPSLLLAVGVVSVLVEWVS